MLVIKGSRTLLPPLTGVFDLTRRLFIVSREMGDVVVWLVSDEVGPALQSPADADQYNERWWLPGVIQALHELAPRVFDRPPPSLEWAVYPALKAEGRWEGEGIPPDERIVKFLRNGWVVWPTKLTLAPLATNTLVEEILERLGRPRAPVAPLPPAWTDLRGPDPVAVARERWRLLEGWLHWSAFDRQYGPF
jgi:hypothetical protein